MKFKLGDYITIDEDDKKGQIIVIDRDDELNPYMINLEPGYRSDEPPKSVDLYDQIKNDSVDDAEILEGLSDNTKVDAWWPEPHLMRLDRNPKLDLI